MVTERELLKKGLNLIQLYLKSLIIIRISVGFIAGGISILGFNNYMPYIVILINPELAENINIANNTLTILGVIMIVIGALIPVFLKIFNHCRKLYINDLNRINDIYSIVDIDTFDTQMNRIANNTSIFDYEIDVVGDFFLKVLDSNFYFNDKKANELVKKMGNELRVFNSEMAMRVFPANGNSRLFIVPKNHQSIQQTASDIKEDCSRLKESFGKIQARFDIITKKKIMRFFK